MNIDMLDFIIWGESTSVRKQGTMFTVRSQCQLVLVNMTSQSVSVSLSLLWRSVMLCAFCGFLNLHHT